MTNKPSERPTETKLWLLKSINPDHNLGWDYDCLYGAVVKAPDEATARELLNNSGHTGTENRKFTREGALKTNVWLDKLFTSCEELTPEGDCEIVIVDFLYG